jgi:hypothetical protein
MATLPFDARLEVVWRIMQDLRTGNLRREADNARPRD